MTGQKVDRASVRKLFDYPDRINEPIWVRPLRLGVLVLAGGIGLSASSALSSLGLGLCVAAATWALLRIGVSGLCWIHKSLARARRARDMTRFARDTIAIQRSDFARGFRRIFQRAMLEPAFLKRLENQASQALESRYFPSVNFRADLGDLFDRSIRIVAQGDFDRGAGDRASTKYPNERTRTLNWESGGFFNFMNPIWSVSLYLTDTEVVICSIQIDSIDQDILEGITRIQVSDIVQVDFSAKRFRRRLTKQETLDRAARQDMSQVEYDAIEQKIHRYQRQKRKAAARAKDAHALKDCSTQSPFFVEQNSSYLVISKTDGGSLSYPLRIIDTMRSDEEEVDQFGEQTSEEQDISRMVNELNRVVRAARATPGAERAEVDLTAGGADSGTIFKQAESLDVGDIRFTPRFSRNLEYDNWKHMRAHLAAAIAVFGLGVILAMAPSARLPESTPLPKPPQAAQAPQRTTLSPTLTRALEGDANLRFACTQPGATGLNIRVGPSTATDLVASVPNNTPVIVQPGEFGKPDDPFSPWLRLRVEFEGEVLDGFVSARLLVLRDRGGPLVCP